MKDPLYVMLLFIAFAAGMCVGLEVESGLQQAKAVKAGVAQFNTKTAAFEWIEHKEPGRDYALQVHNEMIMNRLNNQKCE